MTSPILSRGCWHLVIYCLHPVFCVTRYLSCLFNLSSMASTVDTPNKGSGIQHDRKSWEVAFAEWLKQPGKSKKMWTTDYMKSVVAALSLKDEDVAAMEAGPEKKRVRVWRTRFALVNIAAEGSKAEYVVVRQGGEEEGKRCMHTKGGWGWARYLLQQIPCLLQQIQCLLRQIPCLLQQIPC